MQAQLPRRFGRYTLALSFGRGGMGDAYLASVGEGANRRRCVVKMGLPDPDIGESMPERLANEARLMMSLSCSNIATVLDVGAVEIVPYVAMEFVEGRDLGEIINVTRMRKEAIPIPVVLHIGREVARGLHHAFAESGLRIVHRDVAPPNAVISFTGEVKLIDFGLAHARGRTDRTSPGTVLGHPSYLAPERLRGEPGDHRSDVYSLGVIMWELVTGSPLFPSRAQQNPTVPPGADELIVAPPPSSKRPGVDPDLDALILRALAPDPAKRFADAEQLRLALSRCLVKLAPATDGGTIAAYLRNLLGEDTIDREKRYHEQLLAQVVDAKGTVADETVAVPGQDRWIGVLLDGKYRIDRLCGSGGLGTVYEARHVGIDRKVAVKILRSEHRFEADLVERFQREARLATQADHRNIVEMIDSGRTVDGSRYIVMEYVDGETIQQLLEREQRLSIPKALTIGISVARALEKAHEAGVIHRDLKPGNVMVLPTSLDGRAIKVLDFGVSKALAPPKGQRELTRPLESVGSPLYMAPEQARGESDQRSDVYALGVLIYEMLAGRRPIEADDVLEVIRLKSTTDPPALRGLRPEVSETLNRVIVESLDRDPELRQQNMTELRRDLEGCLGEVEAPEVGPPIAKPGGRTRAAAAIASGLALAAIVAVVTRAALRPNPQTDKAVPEAATPAVAHVPARPSPVVVPVPSEPPVETGADPTLAVAREGGDRDVVTPTATVPIQGKHSLRLAERSRSKGISRVARVSAVEQPPAAPIAVPSEASAGDRPSEALALARRAVNEERFEDALEQATTAARSATSDRDKVAAHILAGDALNMMANFARARVEYQAALKIDPLNARAAKRLDVIRKQHGGL